MNILLTAFSLIPFYLIGCFPTGYLIAKRAGVDIAKHGSGNVGATNVGRVLGKKAGIMTLVGDLLKGLLAVFLGAAIGGPSWYTTAVAVIVVCGHCFSLPPYLKGGKGVATSLGAILALTPLVTLCVLAVFAIFFLWKRIVSLASISAALSAPLFGFILNESESIAAGLAVVALIITYRHRENIQRLVKGIEPRLGR